MPTLRWSLASTETNMFRFEYLLTNYHFIVRCLGCIHNGGMTRNHFVRVPRSFGGLGQSPIGIKLSKREASRL